MENHRETDKRRSAAENKGKARTGEATSLRIAGPEKWEDGQKLRATAKEVRGTKRGRGSPEGPAAATEPTLEICAVVRARKWIANGKTTMVGLVKIEGAEEERRSWHSRGHRERRRPWRR